MPATDHPLGDVDGTAAARPPLPHERSIVDEVLDLDAFLSAEVRTPERTFILYTEPEREARIDELSAEFASLLDPQGRPLAQADAPVGDGVRSAATVATELLAEQTAYFKSGRYMRVRAMTADEWPVWEREHNKALQAGPPYPDEVYESLILRSLVAPSFVDVAQVRKFRAQVGWATYLELGQTCWQANTTSGVDLPKSLLTSAATRLVPRG